MKNENKEKAILMVFSLFCVLFIYAVYYSYTHISPELTKDILSSIENNINLANQTEVTTMQFYLIYITSIFSFGLMIMFAIISVVCSVWVSYIFYITSERKMKENICELQDSINIIKNDISQIKNELKLLRGAKKK